MISTGLYSGDGLEVNETEAEPVSHYQPRILIVDDEPATRCAAKGMLEKIGDLQIVEASNGAECLECLSKYPIDVILLDIHLPDMNGFEVMKSIGQWDARIQVIFLTADSNSQFTIDAMQAGACDYFRKPLNHDQVSQIVRQTLDSRRSLESPLAIRFENSVPACDPKRASSDFIGISSGMLEVFKRIGRVAKQTLSVLITGESGSGKEMVAKSIVSNSNRSHKPFAAINCAAFPEHLLESELFGHEAGAYTGAHTQRFGRFEQCHGGTIFLDEIGDLPLGLQSKFLRLLQEQRFERVGGNTTVQTNVRIIAATNRNLEEMVAKGCFREDLLYRINGFRIHVPPLRERQADIAVLFEHFLRLAMSEMEKQLEGVSRAALTRLQDYAWPGNIRELQATARQAVINTTSTVLDTAALPSHLRGASPQSKDEEAIGLADGLDNLKHNILRDISTGKEDVYHCAHRELDEILMRHALSRDDGNLTMVAKKLGVARNTVRKHAVNLGWNIRTGRK